MRERLNKKQERRSEKNDNDGNYNSHHNIITNNLICKQFGISLQTVDSPLKVLRSFTLQKYGFGKTVINQWKIGKLESRKPN